MGNSRAYPILRTRDLQEALRVARELLQLAEPAGTCPAVADLDAAAITGTRTGLPRYFATLPKARLWWEVPADVASQACAALAPHLEAEPRWDRDGSVTLTPRFTAATLVAMTNLPDLPIELRVLEDPSVGAVEDPFAAAVGDDLGNMLWDLGCWPAVPERDILRRAKYAHVQLAINCEGLYYDTPGPDHILYVHVGSGDADRARWLAETVGQSIVGPKEWGF